MPGPHREGTELGDGALTVDQQMCTHPHVTQAGKGRMGRLIEAPQEKPRHMIEPENPLGQADAMDDNQADLDPRRPRIAMGGAALHGLRQPIVLHDVLVLQ